MNFDLTAEQQMLAETARAFAQRFTEPTAGDPWPAMTDAGWAGLLVSAEFGGGGAGITEVVLLCEALGRAPVVSPLVASGVLAALLVDACGNDEQRARLLPGLAAGTVVGTLALLEPGMRDEWDRVRMPGGPRLSGTKVLVPWAARADVVVVATAGGLVLVEAGAPDVTVEEHHSLDEEPAGALIFDGCPAKAMGDPAASRRALDRALDHAAIATLAHTVGAAERALELSVAHAGDRVQFGRPIGAFQAVAHRCAEMRADLDACRYLAYQAAWALDRSRADADLAVTAALAYAKDAVRRIFLHAHQVHGAIGFSTEYPLHRFTRRAKAFELTYGGGASHRARLAAAMGLRSSP